jgi:hypothetical protein
MRLGPSWVDIVHTLPGLNPSIRSSQSPGLLKMTVVFWAGGYGVGGEALAAEVRLVKDLCGQ